MSRLKQLEGIAVQDQVDSALTLAVGCVQKGGELVRPPEVLVRVPLTGWFATLTHVQVAHDDDGTRRRRLTLGRGHRGPAGE